MTVYGFVEGPRLGPEVIARVVVIYVLYAALQQYLTQRYLAVRLHGWLRSPAPWKTALLVGGLFAILHLPWPVLILPSLGVGFVWSWAYLRLGSVWPIALSHVALAVAFFSFVLVRDPFARVFG